MFQNYKISFSLRNLGAFYILLSISLFLCFYFDSGAVFSVESGMLGLFAIMTVFCLYSFKYAHFPFLLCFVLLLLLMPFFHFLEYIIDNSIIFNGNVFGLNVCAYVQDVVVIKRTLSLAIVGAMGLLLGVVLFRSIKVSKNIKTVLNDITTLTLPVFIFISCLALFLSYIYAPQLSLFDSDYAHGANAFLFEKINFNGSWQMSYAFMVLTLVDTWNDKNRKRKIIKYLIFAVNLFTIVFWLQFMRGDRECFGLVVAVAVLFMLKINISKLKIVICGTVFVLFVFVLQYIGAARSHIHTLGRLPSIKESKMTVATGTWSGALRTPVSVAGDTYYETRKTTQGKTVLSLFLSSIPGPLAKLFNVDRPVTGLKGPAWEMRFGIGGTHCFVVPYMDFGLYGVLFFLILYGVIFAFLESLMDYPSVNKRLLYGVLFVCLPFFIWYGELSFIRGIMSWMIVYCFYLFLPKSKEIL